MAKPSTLFWISSPTYQALLNLETSCKASIKLACTAPQNLIEGFNMLFPRSTSNLHPTLTQSTTSRLSKEYVCVIFLGEGFLCRGVRCPALGELTQNNHNNTNNNNNKTTNNNNNNNNTSYNTDDNQECSGSSTPSFLCLQVPLQLPHPVPHSIASASHRSFA